MSILVFIGLLKILQFINPFYIFILLTGLMKKFIDDNWDFLLEEVDSITISDTFESQNIDAKWQNLWQNNVGKARKVKNELFLNYIYKNEEWLLPFDDVLRKQNLSLPCMMPCSSVTC